MLNCSPSHEARTAGRLDVAFFGISCSRGFLLLGCGCGVQRRAQVLAWGACRGARENAEGRRRESDEEPAICGRQAALALRLHAPSLPATSKASSVTLELRLPSPARLSSAAPLSAAVGSYVSPFCHTPSHCCSPAALQNTPSPSRMSLRNSPR